MMRSTVRHVAQAHVAGNVTTGCPDTACSWRRRRTSFSRSWSAAANSAPRAARTSATIGSSHGASRSFSVVHARPFPSRRTEARNPSVWMVPPPCARPGTDTRSGSQDRTRPRSRSGMRRLEEQHLVAEIKGDPRGAARPSKPRHVRPLAFVEVTRRDGRRRRRDAARSLCSTRSSSGTRRQSATR